MGAEGRDNTARLPWNDLCEMFDFSIGVVRNQ